MVSPDSPSTFTLYIRHFYSSLQPRATLTRCYKKLARKAPPNIYLFKGVMIDARRKESACRLQAQAV